MAHASSHSPRRRILRTLALWLLLAFTIAGAALLAKWKTGQLTANLAPPAIYGGIEARLPKGWEIAHRVRGADTRIVARDPRRTRLLSLHATTAQSQDRVQEFLLRARGMALALGSDDLARYDEPVSITGGQGKIVHLMDVGGTPIASMAFLTFDNAGTVTIELRTVGDRTEADEQMLYGVTQSLRPRPASPAEPAPNDTDAADGIEI